MLILDVDGTLTDGGVYVMEDGKQFKKFHARDGMGIKLAMKAGIEVGIISHSLVIEMVTSRAASLGMKHYYVGQKAKTEVLDEWQQQLNLKDEEIAYIGDDVNDLEIMKRVGFTACPADAAPAIKEVADVCLEKNGGHGAVREFIDNYLLS
ncbi:3-deoxy-D-manno-octulosonate 8-phosphate phosphatase (KDO 8-P phosphatase) [Marinoscillum furvescens DSM 4134]|uniref:3-deoxy-D-manno-octulosonate 8-phosphate phosphatase (KDO 8-P phosphatase) n=2 Tax=Marinoscillum furvescens TaxID=1026 RepID=A0A3D9L3N5_MARFU|nr:3-deoxy-D-manno-octulosonate 8-phosphate phosphatase (KDO 8-P phosphatase) [Marinoscillum furvescens DSM 4134]